MALSDTVTSAVDARFVAQQSMTWTNAFVNGILPKHASEMLVITLRIKRQYADGCPYTANPILR